MGACVKLLMIKPKGINPEEIDPSGYKPLDIIFKSEKVNYFITQVFLSVTNKRQNGPNFVRQLS